MPDSPTLALLRTGAEGLAYPSESDHPLEVIAWGDARVPITEAQIWHFSGQGPPSLD